MKFRELVMFILNFSPNKNVLISNHIYDIISTSGSSISIDLQIKNQQTLMEENHAWKKNKLLNFIFMMRILVFLVKRRPFHHESLFVFLVKRQPFHHESLFVADKSVIDMQSFKQTNHCLLARDVWNERKLKPRKSKARQSCKIGV